MLGTIIRKKKNIVVWMPCLVLFFVMGLTFDRYGTNAYHKYVGISLASLIKSPLAYWRIQQRGWNSFQELQYAQDLSGNHYHKYVETALLPLIIDGKRLSNSYPVPKMGGAITVVGSTVIILDRLGGLYRYDLGSGSFGL